MSDIRVVIADDQALVRAGLATLLGAEPDIEVVGIASDGLEVVELAHELRPDLVCMDIRMPGRDGITATRQIRAAFPDARIVIVSNYDSDELRAAATTAGACGYVVKENLIELRSLLGA